MKSPENNYAFIDGANLHEAMSDLGWNLDYRKLRDYAGLVKFLQERKKFLCILSPSIEKKCSILLAY